MNEIPGNGKLQLTNDGKLELLFIGVGSAFAKTLFQTNFIAVKGDHHVLVDFGTTGPQALRATTGLEPVDIGVMLPTHSHSDHVGGMECLGLTSRYVGVRFQNRPKLRVIINEEYQRLLWDMTLKGGLAWNEVDQSGAPLEFDDYFDVVRPTLKSSGLREIWEVDIGDIHLEMFRTKHIPEQAESWKTSFISYGLFIDNRVFCSVDTRFDRALIDHYAERSEVMFHDVQFFPGSVHAPLSELKTLPAWIRQKMMLIHYSDDWAQHDISDFAGYAIQGHRYVFE